MQSTKLLVKTLKKDHPEFSFHSGKVASWSYPLQKITYCPNDPPYIVLHELSHALLGHNHYHADIDLVKYERDAWKKTQDMCHQYGIRLTDDTIQHHLDTYRLWLHQRSLCPKCNANGIQVTYNSYYCPSCFSEWKVNEARTVQLRRHVIR